jgi:RNA recognition motif-containing protein
MYFMILWLLISALKPLIFNVLPAKIITDRETGRSRGFGFITFATSEEASSALQAMDNQVLSVFVMISSY